MSNGYLDHLTDQIAELSKLQLFFIVGMPRSGTTWLQRMLNNHKFVCCRGESHFVTSFYSKLQKSMKQYHENNLQNGGVIAHLKQFGGHVESLDYTSDEIKLLLYSGMMLMFRKWVSIDSVKAIGEKTPDNLLYMDLLADMFPEAKFIHIVRDGRDCANSGWFLHRNQLASGNIMVDSYEEYVNRYMEQWASSIQISRASQEKYSDRIMQCRYESFIRNPNIELSRVFGFLDIETSPEDLVFCVEEESFVKLTNGRDNGQEDPRSFFRKGIVDDWKSRFSPEIAERAWRVAGSQLAEYGYREF